MNTIQCKFRLFFILSIGVPLLSVLQSCLLRNEASQLYNLYEETREFEERSDAEEEDDASLSVKTIEELKEENEYWVGVLQRIREIDREKLNPEDQLSYDLFKREVLEDVKSYEFEDYLVPINHEGGFHTRIVGMANRVSPDSVKDYENYISRLRSVPEYFEKNIERMRNGIDAGHTLPKVVLVESYKSTITSQIVDDVTESVFYKPFREFPPSIAEAQQKRLMAEGKAAIQEALVPSYERFLQFMEEEYIPNARETIGTSDLPGGEEYYAFLIKHYTTLSLTAEEIHQIGMDEVQRIRSEMETIIDEVGFEGSFSEFLEFLRTDPRFYVDEPEDLMEKAAYIAKRMDGKLPELFNTLPRKPYGIEPVPAHLAPTYTGGRYSSGRGDRAGYYWVNTYNLKSRPLYTLEALTFHEAVPGHHLQIALTRELEDLPEIRTGITAFSEGWALYSERLGLEAGFYTDPYSNFGRLTYEMWRACRLVVDTGIHALGWSREHAVEFMTRNTALSHHEINTEINRYIAVPGQALSYKMGELKIRELREEAENKLGAKFDVREFHDAVLLNGPVTLPALEKQVHAYIEEALAKQGDAQ